MAYASLADLKKSSTQQLNKLREMMEKAESGQSYEKNTNEWTPTWDKDKKLGSAIVRFLPAAKGSDYPWVKVYRHAFKGPTGKWYIENSLTSIGQPDPVGELNSRLWNSGVESDKAVARDQKRKANFYANVLVIRDPAHPENEGKVKVYRFGTKVFDMINDAANPKFEGEPVINAFNPWEGADFVIKMHEVDGYPSYAKSSFKEPAAIGSDEKIDELWDQCVDLGTYLDQSNFKSYDELQNRMYEVLGPDVGSITTLPKNAGVPAAKPKAAAKAAPAADDDVPFETGSKPAKKEPTAKAPAKGGDDFDIDNFLDGLED